MKFYIHGIHKLINVDKGAWKRTDTNDIRLFTRRKIRSTKRPPPLPRARGKTDVTKQLNNTKTCLKRN